MSSWCQHILAIICVASLLSGSASAFTLSGTKWPVSATYFHIDIAALGGTRVAPSGSSCNAAFVQAMSQWNSRTDFHFFPPQDSVTDPCAEDEKNGVAFALSVCGTAFGANTLAVTLLTFTQGNEHIETDILFNGNENWDVYSGPLQENVQDFRRTSIHELGHSIELDHENVAAAIMAPMIESFEMPQTDDINGTNAIYPTSKVISAIPPPPALQTGHLHGRSPDCARRL